MIRFKGQAPSGYVYWISFKVLFLHLIITTITCTIYNVQDYFGQCLLLWIHTDFWNIAHLLKIFSLIIILMLVCVVTSRTLWSMCVSIQLKCFYLSFCLSFIWVLTWICMPRGLGGWRPTHLWHTKGCPGFISQEKIRSSMQNRMQHNNLLSRLFCC